jgi:NAD(P)-dependent dehydrogenase (short-subunit alcohol dehydrogenase family)
MSRWTARSVAGAPGADPQGEGVPREPAVPTPPVRDLFDFTDRVVIVTGGGSGLGSGIALRFAEAGAHVVVHYHASAEGAQAVVAQIDAMSRLAIAVQSDLTKKTHAQELVGHAVRAYSRLDVLINNAGIYPLDTLLDMTEPEWDLVVNTNLRSVFLCTQAAARQMIAQRSADTNSQVDPDSGGPQGTHQGVPLTGAIVNIASIEAENPAPLHAHYNAAKAGVVMLTRSAAGELGPHGIRVNAVSPGLIWRDGIEQQWPDGVTRWRRTAPLTRLGRPDDVADACLFLASPAARWITGANLLVDGGVMTHQIF